jgi:hypothetical protein
VISRVRSSRRIANKHREAWNLAVRRTLLSTLIEARASEGRGSDISNKEQIRCVTIVCTP